MACGIRPAMAADAAAIADIYNSMLGDTPFQADAPGAHVDAWLAAQWAGFASRQTGPSSAGYLSPYNEPMVDAWLDRHRAYRRPIWVSTDASVALGWLSLLGMVDRPGMAAAAELSFYVRSDVQGRGIGDALLGHAI